MKSVKRFAAAVAMVVSVAGAARPASATNGPAIIRGESFYLSVDLSQRRLYVMRDGEEVDSYPVAVGRPKYPTPTGSFRIGHIVWNPHWIPPDSRWARKRRPREAGDPRNPMGRVKMFFREPDLYIHGTREVDSLGEAESHGCIRMRNGTAVDIARLVMAHGGSPRDPSWFRRVMDRVTDTRSVYLSDPVLVEIHH
jgi:lipoprotein-anchoring transpeptidase ErfK/SrfK